MPRHSRILRALALTGVAAALVVQPASAIPPLGETLTTEHFQVHFTGDTLLDNGVHITQRQWVGEMAANMEWAYQTYTSQWGFPAHVPDADGLIDVYIFDFETDYGPDYAGIAGFTIPLSGLDRTAARIEIDQNWVRDPHVAAHETFHVIQVGMYSHAPAWLMESTAEWATFRLMGYPTDETWFSPHEPENSLDCDSVAGGFSIPCGADGYESGGYSRWSFWEYLGERFGQGTVKEVWDRVAAVASPSYDADDAVEDVLVGKSASLTDVFGDYTVAQLTGSMTAPSLAGLKPKTFGTPISTPDTTSTIGSRRVDVNRLATRFVQIQAAAPSERPCYAATLSLTVTLPAGTPSRPYFYNTGTKILTPLSISGTTATASLPWDTCSNEAPGYLSLPNASRTLDGRSFVVSGSITVDTTKIVSAKAPPAGATIGTPILNAPTEDPAPTVSLYAPGVMRLAADASVLRFAAFSNGPGQLRATFGGAELGTVRLRSGSNSVSFKLPRQASRLSFASDATLQLTALSTTGAPGKTVAQRVVFVKSKPKPKRTKPKRRP